MNIVCLYSLCLTVRHDVNLQVMNCSAFYMCCILKAIQYNLLKVRNIEVKISCSKVCQFRENYM